MIARFGSFVALTACALLVGCKPAIPGSGNITVDQRAVEPFDEIEFAGSAKIEVVAGKETTSCEIECDDNLQEFITVKQKGSQLSIYPSANIEPTKGLVIRIASPHLSKLTIAGSAEASVTGLDEKSFDLEIAGSASVRASGLTEKLKVEVAGAASVDCLELSAADVDVEIAGSGDALVSCVKQLKVDIAGSGSVQYFGSPEIKKSIAGVGTIKEVNLSELKREQ